jgi:hypothetical protein
MAIFSKPNSKLAVATHFKSATFGLALTAEIALAALDVVISAQAFGPGF